jgi:diguanylate cyclase (GGDEF)-like protein
MHVDDFSMGITLKFSDKNLENRFLQDVVFSNLFVPRLIYLGGTFLYAIFFILDWFLIADNIRLCAFVRFFVVCPMLIATYCLVGKPVYRKYWTSISLINGFAAGGGMLFLIAQAPSPGNHLYYGGLMLCCLFYYVFEPQQVVSNILSWGVFGLYVVVAILFTDTPLAIFLNNIFIFFFFNIGGMFACYSMELSQRKEFIHKFTIQDQSDRLYQALSDVDQQREKAHMLSLQDSLTGLPNRRHFFSVLARELGPSSKAGQEVSLMLIDIDHFKEINDHFGHVVGDQVLALVAGIIGDTVRQCDTPCRYGGEEFAILLPNTSADIAEKIGRRILEYIASANIPAGRGEEIVTASVGHATLPSGQQSSIENLVELADRALYEAKNCGRNQVRMWTKGLQGYGI